MLLIYKLSDQQSSRGYVIRLNQTTLKPLWLSALNDLELETAVVDAGWLKLKAVNGVVKVDLHSGTFGEK